jgi:hypothetical protein
MAIVGAGLCPAGSSPAGSGVIPTAAVPNTTILPDTVTGLSRGGRYINPKTGAYSFTADGRVQGMATVNQLVFIRATTVRGSSVLPKLGQAITSTQEQQGDFQRRCATEVATMLQDLIQSKQVQLLGVTVQSAPGVSDGAAIFFRWKDLTTGLENTTKYGP